MWLYESNSANLYVKSSNRKWSLSMPVVCMLTSVFVLKDRMTYIEASRVECLVLFVWGCRRSAGSFRGGAQLPLSIDYPQILSKTLNFYCCRCFFLKAFDAGLIDVLNFYCCR